MSNSLQTALRMDKWNLLTGNVSLLRSYGKVDCSSSLYHKRASWQSLGNRPRSWFSGNSQGFIITVFQTISSPLPMLCMKGMEISISQSRSELALLIPPVHCTQCLDCFRNLNVCSSWKPACIKYTMQRKIHLSFS